MSTINPQIDAAVPLMKARAEKFDDTKTMEGMAPRRLVSHAADNLQRAEFRSYRGDLSVELRRDLLDAMNLCALALSVLPKGGS